MLKLVCLSSKISLPSSLKWVVRGAHDKRNIYRGVYGESDAMVDVTKKALAFPK